MLREIIAQRRAEREALELELFSTVYGCDWPEARRLAKAQMDDLIEYAAEWDAALLAFLSTAAAVEETRH